MSRNRHAMGLCYGGNTGLGRSVIIYCICGWSHTVLASLVLGKDERVQAIYNGHLLQLRAGGER